MKRFILAAVAALLTACAPQKANLAADPALTQAGEIVLRAAIRHGVADYLTKHPGNIARVQELTSDLLLVLNSDASTTLGALKELAYSKIPAEFSPIDAQDARDVIDLVALAISQKIGDGELNGQAIVDLRDVLGTISYLAGSFAPK